jgi:hypothetical protein
MENMTKKEWFDIYQKNGYSFFPTGSREKKVLTKWAQYQTRKPSEAEINQWLKNPIDNIAIVCGEISNLVVFDIDTKNGADPTPFQNLGMYEIRTPSGGYHFYCLYDPLLKSTHHQKAKHTGILHAVDVQSNGAIVFAPPSAFPNGKYTITNDVPLTPVPTELLIQVLEALEPEEEATIYTPFQPVANPEKGRPGDIFNALIHWSELLTSLGWKAVGRPTRSGIQYWCRPGKRDGISGSTNWKGYDLFFPYTTSVVGLTPNKGYTKFSLLVALKYGGDPHAAAVDLVKENYLRVYDLV